MAYEHREGQGSLFRNDKKNDRQPDFKGTIMIKGILYNVSAWSRTTQNGREYISMQAEEKTNEQQRPSGGYGAGGYSPRPAYNASAPSPAPAPMPSVDDLPPAGDEEDLPF